MHRIGKLLGIILILGYVFFIICDERGYKINWSENQIVLVETEKKSELNNENKEDEVTKLQPVVVYKNSDLIRINPAFQNPMKMRNSVGMNPEYLAKLEEEKVKNQEKAYTGPNIIALNNKDSIYGMFQGNETQNEDISDEVEDEENIVENEVIEENLETVEPVEVAEELENVENYSIEKYDYKKSDLDLRKGIEIEIPVSEDTKEDVEKYELEAPELEKHSTDLKKGLEPEIILGSIEKYQLSKHNLLLKKGVFVENNFVINALNDEEIKQGGTQLSDSMWADLLENEEIDIDTLESENDDFLQQVFTKTNDTQVMNLIVENYLNEYQFVKAKKFIENLPETYRNELKPSLNLRVSFNSFALTSKTINQTLTSLIQSYKDKNQISIEDENWYLGVLLLMQRKYDDFFAIADRFTSENHKEFTSKLQGYKDQISKQMGMPDYYFDTLVALELFNQGLFQPAKVLALYSLQQNSDYILPYQILAYANFLTNSRETSVEYLKKLVNLDQNNAEKYRFLMGVAYYWAEKYEQSVTMLSMIQNDNLRLDAQRYLINDYLQLDQKNKLILTRNKLLGYEDLVASDFYTYFYEVFYHPYSEGGQYQLYAFDTELTNKMLRVCSMKLSDEEKAVCTYGSIGRNIALGKFEGLEQYLLDLATQYPQGYLYQALGDYYIQQGDNDKARTYLLKAVSMTNNKSEIFQIKNLLQGVM